MLFYFIFFIKSLNECEICKTNVINSKINKKNIIPFKSIKKICNQTLLKEKEICFNIITKFSKILKHEIKNPENVCIAQGKCRTKPIPLSLTQNHKEEFGSNCDYCVKLLTFLFNDGLQTNGAPLGIKLLQNMCENIPPAVPICNQVTQHHIEKILLLVTSKIELHDICQSMGYCT